MRIRSRIAAPGKAREPHTQPTRLAQTACVTQSAREGQCPLTAAGAADCRRAAHGQAAASHGRIPRNSHSHSTCYSRARVPACPPARPSQTACAQCPPTFLRGRTHALTLHACLLPPRASLPEQGTHPAHSRTCRLVRERPPPLSVHAKSGGGGPSPPPPRAVTPWCRPSCARPVCVCASDARSGRRRRRSCSLCGSRSCPGPRCGRCRRIRA